MPSIQKIKEDVNTNIKKFQDFYSGHHSDFLNQNDYDLEYQKRIDNIKQKIVQSSATSNAKQELDLLLEIIENIDYLLSFKHEFKDNKDVEQIKLESDLIAIEFGFLYLNYCLDISNIHKVPENYINNSLSPLELIAHIFICRSNGLYHIELSKIEEMLTAFQTLVNNSKVCDDVITVDRYNFETYQNLKFKLSKSLQSIYSCLFILNNIKQERKSNNEEKIIDLFLSKNTHDFIKKQEKDFLNIDRDSLAKYCGKFIYFENGKIIDSDINEDLLVERVMERVNYRSVFITKVDCDKE